MRNKFVRTLLVALLVFALLAVPAYAESASVTADDVNMREGPGTGYRVVACLPLGAQVEVVSEDGGWCYVRYDGAEGYLAAQYLSREELKTERFDSSESAGTINTDGVRFRSRPDSQASILAEYDAGTPVIITGVAENGWLPCRIDGQEGYIYGDYISKGSVSTTRTDSRAVSPSYAEIGDSAYVVMGDGGFSPLDEPSSPEAPWDQQVQAPSTTPAATRQEVETSSPTGSDRPSSTRSGATTVESNISSVDDGNVSTFPSPEPTSSSRTPSSSGDGKSGIITGDYVRFRSGPSSSHSILGTYNYGTKLTILGTSGDWTYCRIDGRDGYVFSSYVQVTQNSSNSSNNSGSSVNSGDGPVSFDDIEIPTNYRSTVHRTRGGSVTSNVDINPAKIPSYWPGSTANQVSTDPTTAYINANSVRFRSAPSMSSEILGELSFGNSVTITGTVGEWTAITYKGNAGYVYSSYVTKGQYQSSSVGGTVKGREIADYALQYVGYRYVWGGASPSTGFDCSGLVYYVYKHFGYTLNRVAADQAKNGVHVDPSNLQPGDILCFYSGNSYIGHVGIYIGNNRFVHAQNSATGVVTTELAGYYAERGYEARRII